MGILRISCGHGDGGLSGQGISGGWEVQSGGMSSRAAGVAVVEDSRVLCAGADWWRGAAEVSGYFASTRYARSKSDEE